MLCKCWARAALNLLLQESTDKLMPRMGHDDMCDRDIYQLLFNAHSQVREPCIQGTSPMFST